MTEGIKGLPGWPTPGKCGCENVEVVQVVGDHIDKLNDSAKQSDHGLLGRLSCVGVNKDGLCTLEASGPAIYSQTGPIIEVNTFLRSLARKTGQPVEQARPIRDPKSNRTYDSRDYLW